MEQTKELNTLRHILIDLHTARWTGNQAMFAFILDKIGNYSYARTNGTGDEEYEERVQEETLEALNWTIDEFEKWKAKKDEFIDKK